MATDPRRIILVDDEEVLAWSLANRLARVRPGWTIDTANDGETALAMVRSGQRVDLLVADVRMPGMSGIDLILAARKEHENLPVVVMTAFRTPEVQRIVGAPYTGFLEKPFEFDRLLELVDEALAVRQEVGFSGAISVTTLPDIVQLYVLSSATGMLVVRHHSGEGRLWFDRGAIQHAVSPNKVGDEAFYEIMMWSGGQFTMRAGIKTDLRSIRSSWQELLMESCRIVDERGRERAMHQPSESPTVRSRTGWTQAPPPPDPDVEVAFEEFERDLELELEALPATDHPTTRPEALEVLPPAEVPMNIKDSLAKLNNLDGFVGAALVDAESGMLLGSEGGGGMNLEVAAAGNTEVVRAKRKTMSNLGLKDAVEDILISLGKQYHIIRPLRSRSTLFFYVALDRSRANLAMARITLADVEKELQV